MQQPMMPPPQQQPQVFPDLQKPASGGEQPVAGMPVIPPSMPPSMPPSNPPAAGVNEIDDF